MVEIQSNNTTATATSIKAVGFSNPNLITQLDRFHAELPITDKENIAALTSMMVLSYKDQQEIVKDFPVKSSEVRNEGWTNYTMADGKVLTAFDYGQSTQSYIMTDPKTGNIFVTFRGSAGLTDWMADLTPGFVADRNGGMAHAGFQAAMHESIRPGMRVRGDGYQPGKDIYADMQHAIADAQSELRAQGIEPHIFVSGHSLGGAMAEKFARDMEADGHHIDGVVTIAQPAVGDQEYANKTHALLGSRHLRIYDHNDMVPDGVAQCVHSVRGVDLDTLAPDLTGELWHERFANFTSRISSHFSHDNYESKILVHEEGYISEINRATPIVLDRLKKSGMAKAEDLHTLPVDAASLSRILLEHKDELINSGIRSQDFEKRFKEVRDYAALHPDDRVDKIPSFATHGLKGTAFERNSAREEDAINNPSFISGKLQHSKANTNNHSVYADIGEALADSKSVGSGIMNTIATAGNTIYTKGLGSLVPQFLRNLGVSEQQGMGDAARDGTTEAAKLAATVKERIQDFNDAPLHSVHDVLSVLTGEYHFNKMLEDDKKLAYSETHAPAAVPGGKSPPSRGTGGGNTPAG